VEIICAHSAGFCFGVRRALELAYKAVESHGHICSLGPLIHNQSVVDDLSKKGVKVIEDLSQAHGKPVLIRSHGAVPEIFKQARAEGIVLIDATCPFVKRVQKRAAELTGQGYQVVVVGQANHPEVKSILGWTGDTAVVVESAIEVAKLPNYDQIGVLVQTTQNRCHFYALSKDLVEKGQEVRIYDTICKASIARQEEAADIARKVEAMVVVGGRNSANSCQLADICAQFVTTYHIEGVEELAPGIFNGLHTMGLTAGASTPDWIIEEVVERMGIEEENEKAQVEGGTATEVAPESVETVTRADNEQDEGPEEKRSENMEPAAVATPSADDEPTVATVSAVDAPVENNDAPEPGQEEMMNLNLGTTKQIQQGDVISGTVVQVKEDEVLIDIGGKSEGVIPRQELENKGEPGEELHVGDVISVYVLRADNDEGHLTLSKKRADRAKALDYLEECVGTDTKLAGEVIKVVKGGLLTDVNGIRGFVPASLVERGYVGDLEKYVGATLRLRVIEFDRNRGKVVLSQKVILQEEYLKAEKELWETIEPGEIRKGTVRHLTNFGAFVDLGGVDGLLHISELSWGRVKHPSEVVQEGDEVDVYVISVDKDNKRISLSLKQAQTNPWSTVDERYQVGEIITGTIVRLVSFGAFVEIEPGVEGLVHISRLSDHRVGKPEDVVTVGQEIQVKVLEINKQDQRISLSIKDAMEKTEAPREKVKEKGEKKHNQEMTSYSTDNTGVGVNLGDVFGDLFAHNEQKS
jgi:ribosomal protein S1/(E)-4-hydroxy-3-methyl-but-2-enyl pyrophosphate reductase